MDKEGEYQGGKERFSFDLVLFIIKSIRYRHIEVEEWKEIRKKRRKKKK